MASYPPERDFAAVIGRYGRVRKNSGVYAIGKQELVNIAEAGIGPFGNLGARFVIELEIAALAATRMRDAVLQKFTDTIAMMRWEHT